METQMKQDWLAKEEMEQEQALQQQEKDARKVAYEATVESVAEELFFMMKDNFVGRICLEGGVIKMRIPNGQNFVVEVREA